MSDAIWMDVLPSLAGFASTLTRETAGPAASAGQTAGAAWSEAMQGSGAGGAAALVAELEKASSQSATTVAKLSQQVGAARAAERSAAANLILAEQKLIDMREKFGEGSAQALAAELRLESAREKAEQSSIRYTAAEDQLKAAQRERREITAQLEDATTSLADGTGDLGGDVGALADEVGGQGSVWGRFRDSLTGSGDDADGLADSLGGIIAQAALAAGAAATFAEAWSLNMDLDAGTAKVTAQMRLTEDESAKVGAVAGSLYASAYGESMEDVTSSVGAVMASIKGLRSGSDEEIEAVSAAALTLASVFDVDVAEGAAAAGLLINNGLAKDGVAAFDLLTAAAQNVPPAMTGDLMEAANEYGTFFASLGYGGEEMFTALMDGANNGAIGLDKAGDAIKEFTIRATDGSTSTVEALESIGLNATDMSNQILAGGDTARSATQDIVDGLLGISDPSAQAAAAIALFGTPLEDMNVTEIPNFLGSLSNMSGGLGEVEGAGAAAADALDNHVGASLETLKRGFMGAVTEGIEPMIEPAEKVLSWASSIPGGFEAAAIAVGALGAGVAIYTVAQWAMNTAMFASPIFWVVAALGLLVAAIILVASNWETVTTFISEKWNTFTAWLGETLDSMGTWIGEKWDAMWAYVTEKWGEFTTWLGESLDAMGVWFVEKWDGLVAFITEWGPRFLIAISGPIGWLVAWLVTNWDSISTTAQQKWQGLLDWIGGIPGWFSEKLAPLGQLASKVGGYVTGAKDAAIAKFNELTTWVGGLPAAIKTKLGDMGSLLSDAGKQIISGFLSGLKSKFVEVKNWVGGVGTWIADNKGPKAYDLGLLVPAGGWIMDGLRSGMEAQIPALGQTLKKVSDAIQVGSDLRATIRGTVPNGAALAVPSAASLAAATGGGATGARTWQVEHMHMGATAEEVLEATRWEERTNAL